LRLVSERFVFVYINVVKRGFSEGDLSLRTFAHHIWYTIFHTRYAVYHIRCAWVCVFEGAREFE